MDLSNISKSHTELLHEVFNQSAEGFQVINKNWVYVFANEAVAKQGKSTVDELIGHTMMEKYPGIEKTPLFTEMQRVMEKGVGLRMENEFVFPDGEKGWFQLFIHPWSGGIMIFSIDVTTRRLAEQRLAKMIENIQETSSEPDKAKLEEVKKALEELNKPSVTVIS